MEQALLRTKAFRTLFSNIIQELSEKELDIIPNGFNNNIRWQAAHLIVTPFLLLYKPTDTAIPLEESFIANFRKGSSPKEQTILLKECNKDFLLENLMDTISTVEKDLSTLDRKTFTPLVTSSGYKITSIYDAFAYSNVHDGLHLGNVMAIKKIIAS